MIDPLHAALIAQAAASAIRLPCSRDDVEMALVHNYEAYCLLIGITPLDLGKLRNSSSMFCCCCGAPATIDNMVMGGNGCRVCREQSEVSESIPPPPRHDAVGRRI
jgi:hypothetical protein